MASAEEEATQAIYKFYDALDQLLRGQGSGAMKEVWQHGPGVTTSHPFGDWARGWAEVWATWDESTAIWALYKGHEGRTDTVGTVEGLRVVVMGDVALATCVFKGHMYMSTGPLKLTANCTNVAQRIDGVWKLVHHHADQAPAEWSATIGAMVQRGHS